MSTGFSLTNYGKISKEQWEEEVKKTLPEEQFQSLMHFKEEGFSINALYTSEETKRLSYLEKYHHKLPNHEDQRTWHVIANWESEQQTINAFTYGCRGLKIDIDDIFDLPENLILKLKGKFISVTMNEFSKHTLQDLSLWLEKKEIRDHIQGTINDDFTNQWDDDDIDFKFDELKSSLRWLGKKSPFKLINVQSKEEEVTTSQAIAIVLSKAVTYLDELSDYGIDPQVIVKHIHFTIPITQSFFKEIAKLKALRILFHKIITEGYEVTDQHPEHTHIHTDISITKDNTINPLIPLTIGASTAIFGGCTTLSFDQNEYQRNAWNISNILREESFLSKAVDPMAGSYYIEHLSDAMIKKAWHHFLQIEKHGGFLKVMNDSVMKDILKS